MLSQIIWVVLHLCGQGNLITTVCRVREFLLSNRVETLYVMLTFIYVCVGQIDSNWCVGAVMEKKLHPLPFTLALSSYINHVKNAFRFGIGFILG